VGEQCDLGQRCAMDSDCVSATCDTLTAIHTCVSCNDNSQNGQETDTDCGGGLCAACTAASSCTNPLDIATCSNPAQNCRDDSDCTDSCYKPFGATTGSCVSSTNGVKDGQEGGPDCGFRADTICAIGTACTTANDCSTGICTSGVCASPAPPPANAACPSDGTANGAISISTGRMCRVSCENGVRDGTETDVDCGGEYCRTAGYTCSAGGASTLPHMCAISADCDSGACSLSTEGLQCETTASCTQGYGMANTMCYMPAPRDGYCEVTYSACSDVAPCEATPVGNNQACIRFPGECVGTCSSCSDGRINGAETDVDCGGGPGSCDGCSISQSCGCGINSGTGVCSLHRDCGGGLQCYAPLPAGGMPSASADRTRALSVAQDSAVCILPGTISVEAAEPVETSPGRTLLRKLSVAGSSPSGVENPCIVTATVGASGGVRATMQNYETRLAASTECGTTSVSVTTSGSTQITGPYSCVDMVLSDLRLDTTCDSTWIEGDTPELDRVEATVLATLTSTDAACGIGTDIARLTVSLVGRPVLVVTGVAINGDCIDSDPDGCANERDDLAIIDVTVLGSVESCGDDADEAEEVADCSLVPHPDGIPGGCCDAAEPFRMGSQVKSCPQLLAQGWNCNMATVLINMRESCANTCGFCPPVPPPPPPVSTVTPTVPVDAVDTGVTSQGRFTLPIPLGMSGANDGNVLLTLSKDGYVDTKVVVPVVNGNVDVGHIVMVSELESLQFEIQGSCLDLYSSAAQREGLGSSDTEMTATLYEGQVIYPARPATPYPRQNDPSAGSSIARGEVYRFTGVPAGTYTVVCEVGGVRVDRYVYSASAMPAFDAVAIPSLYATGEPASADEFGGILSGGEIMISVDWQVMGDRATARDADSERLGRPDLDINGMFQATEDESCHIFYDYPRCGDVELLPDFGAGAAATPALFWEDCGADPTSCNILDGPVTSVPGTTVPSEAIIIRQVRGAIYTFYVQYSNANLANVDLLYPGVDPAAFSDSESTRNYLRVVEVNADVFAGSSRIAHTVGAFEVPGTTPYMRLFCIDATSGAPKVFPALMMSETPPEMCTSCPC